jgi:CMP-N,N'-diacetyllegionaminic acid synthase
MLVLTDFIIAASESLRSALQQMTNNRRGVLFVCENGVHIVGVLSDGDVRRALLDGTLLLSPVEKVMNTDPITAPTSEQASELLRKLAVVAVPIVDAKGRIIAAVVEDQDRILFLTEQPASRPDEESRSGVVAIIPARGGSKRIPRKNLAMLAGKTLLARSIEAAKSATAVSHVIVSTDDRQIADAARVQGVDVPWLRPQELSGDDTPTIEVLVHAVAWAVNSIEPEPEFGVLLEPTAPLRTGQQIDEAISLLSKSDADCVASVSEVPHVLNPEELLVCEHGALRPFVEFRTMDTRRLRGQQRSVYVQNGLVYAFRVQSLLSQHSLYGHRTLPLFTKWEDFVDIDTSEDLELAALRLQRCYAAS